MGGVLVYLRRETVAASESEKLSMPPLSVMLFLALPVLSIVGAILVTLYANNIVALFTTISIVLLFSLGLLSKTFLPPKFYSLAVLMTAIAILFQSSLVSSYIVTFGSDIPNEFIAFNLTKTSGFWGSTNPFSGSAFFGRYYSMLSITILPTIYSALLNLNFTWMSKLLIPFLFSLVPVTLYYAWKEQIGAKYAFISAFLFMSQLTFYTEMLGLDRQMIAELFLALLLFVLFSNRLKQPEKIMCFMVFGAAMIVSHYALALIFLSFILAVWLLSIFLKISNRKLTLGLIVLFSVMMLVWYIYTSSGAAFSSMMSFGTYVGNQLGSFFNVNSRGTTVLEGVGLASSPSILNTISRMFAYFTEGLIAIGFIGLVWQKLKKPQLKDQYFAFAAVAMILLFALIAVPGLANTLNMTRFYHILLFILAPLCAMGGQEIVKILSKKEKEFWITILLLLILVPYFLFQTNFAFEIAKSESGFSVALSTDRMSPLQLYDQAGYTDVYSVFGAQWLARYCNPDPLLYSDASSALNVLLTYGLTYNFTILSNATTVGKGGVAYLNTLNVKYGIVVGSTLTWNSTDLSATFNSLNVVYDNGNSAVYQNPR
jgi:uncharacterized membrane protein